VSDADPEQMAVDPYLGLDLLDISIEETVDSLDLERIDLGKMADVEEEDSKRSNSRYAELVSLVCVYVDELLEWFRELNIKELDCPLAIPGLRILVYDGGLIFSRVKRVTSYSGSMPDNLDFFLGIAKVSIISIDRSLKLWDLILDLLPEQKSDGLILKEFLVDIRVLMDELFPGAMLFIRPGLDE